MDEKTFQKDPKKLIFDEFQLGEPIFESYKNFCRKMGSNLLNYPEFEFWWMRFSAGNFDFNHDRSQDPKYRTIEDIPVHIFKKICGNLKDDRENNYWFTLRHVCKSFRTIVDSWDPPKFTEIGISCYRREITMSFYHFQNSNSEISYIEKSENLSEIRFRHHPNSLQRGNFGDLAAEDLAQILAVSGGCELEHLSFSGDINSLFAQKLFENCENLGTEIHVDTVCLHPYNIDPITANYILNSFPSIKTIDIKSEDLPDEEFTDKIKAITSLKNAEMVKINNTRRDDDDVFWDPSGLMIPRMTVKLGRSRANDCLRLLQALLKSPHLEYCHVIGYVKRSKTLETGLKKCGAVEVHPRNSEIFSWPIPNSDEFFEIKFIRNHCRDHYNTIKHSGIHIRRKSKFARFNN